MARTPAPEKPARPRPPRQPVSPGESSEEPSRSHPVRRPDVYVDFSLADGLLVVTLANIGDASAYDVAVRFDSPFHGLGGKTDIGAIALFHSLLFLPPAKRITQLVDHADAYFRRGEPLRLTATVGYADRDGRRFEERIAHDLAVYRDLVEPLPR